MEVFPAAVRRAMVGEGTAVTCLPVRLDREAWEAAVFFHLAGEESRPDREALGGTREPVPVGLETDLMPLESAAVVVLRGEVHLPGQEPLVGEVLLTPGAGGPHFEVLDLLSRQDRLCWFFGDTACRVLHAQEHPLEPDHRQEFGSLLQEAVEHDALVRFTGRYDAGAALGEVTAHYSLRSRHTTEPRTPQ